VTDAPGGLTAGAALPVPARLAAALMALACGVLAAWLGVHHPVFGAAMLLPLAAVAALAGRAPGAWPLWLLPLLPLVGGMPWTGWLVVEEFDLLVLATAAAGYARWALAPPAAPRGRWHLGAMLAGVLLAAHAGALTTSLLRGVADAGGWQWSSHAGWWQGYHEPLNALRLGKSLPLALLLLPLWLREHRARPARARQHLLAGLAGMAAAVALTVLWERLAHTGLTNFSSDYRATGLFWEMHVGGAALDAALIATLPAALLVLLRAHDRLAWACAAAALMAAAYAALATFSRVVYLGAPVALTLLLGLRWMQQRAGGRGLAAPGPEDAGAAQPRAAARAGVALALAFAGAGLVVFPGGGYRGLLALLGAFALSLAALPAMAAARRGVIVAGVVGGLLAAGLVLAATLAVPKGAYAAYLAVAGGGALCWVACRRARSVDSMAADLARAGLMAAALGLWAGAVAVVWYWGEGRALAAAALAACVLVASLLGLAAARRTPWPAATRWQAGQVGVLAVLALVIGVFSGGGYMGGRWQSLEGDAASRLGHARHALSLLRAPGDDAFGKGLGRYAATQTMSGDADHQIGDYRLRAADGRQVLLLTSGRHILGWGQLFRISQRIDAPTLPLRVRTTLRAEARVDLHAEVCEKHLLYNGTCVVGHRGADPAGGAWQTLEWELKGGQPSRGSALAPRFIVFSFALGSQGSRAEFDRVELIAGDGRQLLANPGFDDGMARWFFSSDHLHMPWHAKNLALHLVFEQGVVGLALFTLLGVAALWRVTLGSARREPLAPALAAALVGLAVVGLADSLLDMPRIAWLIYVVIGLALFIRPQTGVAESPGRTVR